MLWTRSFAHCVSIAFWLFRSTCCLVCLAAASLSGVCCSSLCIRYMYNGMPETPQLSDVPWGLASALGFWLNIGLHVAMCCTLVHQCSPWAVARRREPGLEELLRRLEVPARAPAASGECPICCTSLAGKAKLASPTCGHSFHAECLRHWLRRRPTCPVCRFDVRQANPV
mmetsp:Transcript_71834/g.214461  ORF Transcript_71834/g.214461 Transcript_71834/m.214461 type:complete len:170 (-) Transcript_71834:51-560(-)